MPLTLSNVLAEFPEFDYQMLDECTTGLAKVGRKGNKRVKVTFVTDDQPFDLRACLEHRGVVLWFKRDEFQQALDKLDNYSNDRYHHAATKDLMRLRSVLQQCKASGALEAITEGGAAQTLLESIETFFEEGDHG
jgi:hypothetical protein